MTDRLTEARDRVLARMECDNPSDEEPCRVCERALDALLAAYADSLRTTSETLDFEEAGRAATKRGYTYDDAHVGEGTRDSLDAQLRLAVGLEREKVKELEEYVGRIRRAAMPCDGTSDAAALRYIKAALWPDTHPLTEGK